VDRDNVRDVATTVAPGSLIGVAVNPDLVLDDTVDDVNFTAFSGPLVPGELAYRAYPGGVESIEEVEAEGFDLAVRDAVLNRWCAVVPDADGVIRGRWERIED
jgi:hypothetical protein